MMLENTQFVGRGQKFFAEMDRLTIVGAAKGCPFVLGHQPRVGHWRRWI